MSSSHSVSAVRPCRDGSLGAGGLVDNRDRLTARFEQVRPRLRSVAYSILGTMTDADDALQDCWLRLDRSDPSNVEDLEGWLITVVGRICLDMLRRRAHRRERQFGDWLPE